MKGSAERRNKKIEPQEAQNQRTNAGRGLERSTNGDTFTI
jgi:hypothetical protein